MDKMRFTYVTNAHTNHAQRKTAGTDQSGYMTRTDVNMAKY